MPAKKLDPSFWDTVPTQSGHGLNVKEHLSKYLQKLFPEFVFGFFIKDDLEHRRTVEGYEVLNRDYWEAVSPWNDETAFRHGLKLVDGAIMQGNNFVCARPRNWDERRRAQINREENAKFQAARRGRAAIIKERSPEGVEVGSSVVQSVNAIPPEVFKEPETIDEDIKGGDIFTNVNTGGKLQVTVDLPKFSKMPEEVAASPAAVVPKKKGRPKGSKSKPKTV